MESGTITAWAVQYACRNEVCPLRRVIQEDRRACEHCGWMLMIAVIKMTRACFTRGERVG